MRVIRGRSPDVVPTKVGNQFQIDWIPPDHDPGFAGMTAISKYDTFAKGSTFFEFFCQVGYAGPKVEEVSFLRLLQIRVRVVLF